MDPDRRTERPFGPTEEVVFKKVLSIYEARESRTPFHGLHHLLFVRDIATMAAVELGAHLEKVRVAALVHDLNYLFGKERAKEQASVLRAGILRSSAAPKGWGEDIENIVNEAATSSRGANICLEAQSLSDGDTAFKSLPIVPLLSVLYMLETERSLEELAGKIIGEQSKLARQGIYFYSESVGGEFSIMGEANLEVWRRADYFLKDSISDPIKTAVDRAVQDLHAWWIAGPGRPMRDEGHLGSE